MNMNILSVIYKDITVNINHSTINIYEDYIQIFLLELKIMIANSFVNGLMLIELIMKRKKEILTQLLKLILIYSI